MCCETVLKWRCGCVFKYTIAPCPGRATNNCFGIDRLQNWVEGECRGPNSNCRQPSRITQNRWESPEEGNFGHLPAPQRPNNRWTSWEVDGPEGKQTFLTAEFPGHASAPAQIPARRGSNAGGFPTGARFVEIKPRQSSMAGARQQSRHESRASARYEPSPPSSPLQSRYTSRAESRHGSVAGTTQHESSAPRAPAPRAPTPRAPAPRPSAPRPPLQTRHESIAPSRRVSVCESNYSRPTLVEPSWQSSRQPSVSNHSPEPKRRTSVSGQTKLPFFASLFVPKGLQPTRNNDGDIAVGRQPRGSKSRRGSSAGQPLLSPPTDFPARSNHVSRHGSVSGSGSTQQNIVEPSRRPSVAGYNQEPRRRTSVSGQAKLPFFASLFVPKELHPTRNNEGAIALARAPRGSRTRRGSSSGQPLLLPAEYPTAPAPPSLFKRPSLSGNRSVHELSRVPRF